MPTELFDGSGSVAPAGTVTLATFASWAAAAAGETVAVTVYVSLPPTGIAVAESLMLPFPPAVHVAPSTPTHVRVAFVSCDGSESVTVAPFTALGPAFVTSIVYVTVPPAATDVAGLVIVMPRFAYATPFVTFV